jgi:hypothetical protein
VLIPAIAKIDKHVCLKADIFLPVEYYSASFPSDKCASHSATQKTQICLQRRSRRAAPSAPSGSSGVAQATAKSLARAKRRPL